MRCVVGWAEFHWRRRSEELRSTRRSRAPKNEQPAASVRETWQSSSHNVWYSVAQKHSCTYRPRPHWPQTRVSFGSTSHRGVTSRTPGPALTVMIRDFALLLMIVQASRARKSRPKPNLLAGIYFWSGIYFDRRTSQVLFRSVRVTTQGMVLNMVWPLVEVASVAGKLVALIRHG